MAKVKYDPSKRNPNFKVGDIPEVEGAINPVVATLVEMKINSPSKLPAKNKIDKPINSKIGKSNFETESKHDEME